MQSFELLHKNRISTLYMHVYEYGFSKCIVACVHVSGYAVYNPIYTLKVLEINTSGKNEFNKYWVISQQLSGRTRTQI